MTESMPSFDPRNEGAIARFDSAFIERHGKESVFVRALSDLWTSAMARLLRASGRIDDQSLIVLLANDDAVTTLRVLTRKNESLKRALFQEPFGFVAFGAIEAAFDEAFGAEAYRSWLVALEGENYDRCFALTE